MAKFIQGLRSHLCNGALNGIFCRKNAGLVLTAEARRITRNHMLVISIEKMAGEKK